MTIHFFRCIWKSSKSQVGSHDLRTVATAAGATAALRPDGRNLTGPASSRDRSTGDRWGPGLCGSESGKLLPLVLRKTMENL